MKRRAAEGASAPARSCSAPLDHENAGSGADVRCHDARVRYPIWILRAGVVSAALTALGAGCAENGPAASPQADADDEARAGALDAWQLEAWTREGCAVQLARVTEDKTEREGNRDIESIRVKVEETLWGEPGAPERGYRITRHVDPPPGMRHRQRVGPRGPRPVGPRPPRGPRPTGPRVIWPRSLKPGTLLLLITRPPRGGAERGWEPIHVSAARDAKAPATSALRALLGEERSATDGAARRGRYLRWLGEGSPLQRRFAASALARSESLPDVDPNGDVAAALSASFARECDLDLLDAMVASILPRTSAAGQAEVLATIVRGTLKCPETEAEFARTTLDTLSVDSLGPKREETATLLRARLQKEASPALREELLRLVARVERPPR